MRHEAKPGPAASVDLNVSDFGTEGNRENEGPNDFAPLAGLRSLRFLLFNNPTGLEFRSVCINQRKFVKSAVQTSAVAELTG
jgi:hypothetical protein